MWSWDTIGARVMVGLLSLPAALPAAHAREPAAQRSAVANCPISGASAKQRGDEAMLAGEHAIALACYDEVYRAAPSPAGLYNRARANEFLGRRAEALRLLRQFQREADPALLERVPGLSELAEKLRTQVADVAVTANVQGATVLLDDQPVGTAPMESLLLDAGPARLEVKAPGYQRFQLPVVALAGQRLTVSASLVPLPARVQAAEQAERPPALPAANPRPTATTASAQPTATTRTTELGSIQARTGPVPRLVSPPSTGKPQPEVQLRTDAPPAALSRPADGSPGVDRKRYGWAALGAGGAGLAVSAVSFLAARSAKNRTCENGEASCPAAEFDHNANARFERWRGVFYGALALGAGGLVTGGVLLWEADDPSDGSRARISAGLGIEGLSVHGRF